MRSTALIIALFLALLPLLLVGCVTTAEAELSREHAVVTRERLAADARVLQASLDALPPDDPTRPALATKLVGTQVAIDTLSQGIAQIDAALTSQPGDTVLDALTDALPAPWRAPLILGGVGLGLLLRSRQLRDGITTIAQGIEIAKANDPAFRESFQRNANTFRSIQSSTARKLVDEITGRVLPTPQPAAPGQSIVSSAPVQPRTSKKPRASYSQES